MFKNNNEKIIKKITDIHKGLYTYPNLDYVNRYDNINVFCKKHGEFKIRYRRHINGKGCQKCSQELILGEYIQEVSVIHQDKYDYSKVKVLKVLKEKIKIICKEHGEFTQYAHLHKQGNGCPKCSVLRVSDKNKKTREEVIQNFQKVHQDKYDYSKVAFEKMTKEVKIICKKCKKIFRQQPRHHREGKGCPNCAVYGYKTDKPGLIYYLKVNYKDEFYYKIGITNNTVKKRYGLEEMGYMTILKEHKFENGLFAYKLEQKILNRYVDFKYKGEYFLKSGNTELFTKDVLNLDIFALPEMQINPVEIEVEVEDRTH